MLRHKQRSCANGLFWGALDGSCRTPIAGHATIAGDRLSFFGMILTPDGTVFHESRASGPVSDASVLGAEAGMEVRGRAGTSFFDSWV